MRSAAILAGGRATRFGGRDKSALVVDGRSILERQVAELSTVVDDVMIVASIDSAAGRAAVDRARGLRHIADIVPGCAPLAALHAALAAIRGARVLWLVGDMPYVEAAFAGFLLWIAGDAAIVVPETDRGYHPLCAVYTRACLEPVAARLAERRLMLRELVDDVPTRI